MKGRVTWFPSYLSDEVEDIMREKRIPKRPMAIMELVKYARVGREVERLASFNLFAWKKKKKLPPVEEYIKRLR